LTIKIVITGATGFIGAALCKKLEEKKEYSIIKVTRSQESKVGFYQVTNYQQTPLGDILIHLGEDSDRPRVNKMGDLSRQMTRKVMKSLLMKGYKKIVYCSSSTVYGDQETEPYRENMPTYADDIYSAAKLENEERVLNLDGTVVRFSNVIGNGMSKKNVLSDIINQLSKPTSITIHNIKPIRDFILIDDAVDAVAGLVEKEVSGLFNIGSGMETSINQLIKMVLNLAKQEDRKINSTMKNSEYSYNVLNIEKIKKVTNWQPKFTLAQSIEKIINGL
jgi:nucleoside-diphosphate-sugar epimerase